MTENPCTALVPLNEEAVREAVSHLLKSADHASVQRLYSTLTKKRGTHHSCAVRSTLKSNWHPTSATEARIVTSLLRDRVGLVQVAQAPPDEAENKILVKSISKRLMDIDGANQCTGNRAKYSHRVSAIMCRIVEAAKELSAEEGVSSVICMHGHTSSLTHGKVRDSIGSGLVYNGAREQDLLDRAIDRVETRLFPQTEEAADSM